MFAGPYIRLPLGQLKLDANGAAERYGFSRTPGVALGGEAGIYTGPGILFLDVRYAQDFVYVRANGVKQYRTGSFAFSLGYKMGFLPADFKFFGGK